MLTFVLIPRLSLENNDRWKDEIAFRNLTYRETRRAAVQPYM